MSTVKTKFMVVGHNVTEEDQQSISVANSEEIEMVKEFQ